MTLPRVALRALGLLGVAAGIVDPGCAVSGRPHIEVTTVGDLPASVRAQTLTQVADAAPWAHVTEASASAGQQAEAPPAARVVAGDPAPVLQALEVRPADLALQVDDPALTLASLAAPARVVVGMRVDVAVGIEGVPEGQGELRVVLRDAGSGLAQGHTDVDATSVSNGRLDVRVPWLATRAGTTRLQVESSYDGTRRVRPAPPGEVTVDVRPADADVAVLEARPTWGARFARLALARSERVRVRSDVRVSPGVSVHTATGDVSARGPGGDDADVVLVGGLEALASSDVARLDRVARVRGRAVVLLVDDAPSAGPWRRLWPGGIGPVRTAPQPVTGLVAGHPWKMREWLSPALSTEVVPLAYVDSESTPFVVGRAVGAGRIVLVTALDAWRWRAAEGIAFGEGWRALVQRLASDVPPPVATMAWVTGRGRVRTLHVDVAVRPDVADRGTVAVMAHVEAGGRQPVPLAPIGTGRWRGATRLQTSDTAQLLVEVRAGSAVVEQGRVVVDNRAAAPVASWEDVEQHQSERGALTAGPRTLADGLTGLRTRLAPPEARRWHITRTWWFAAVVLAILGAEWILRRRQGNR